MLLGIINNNILTCMEYPNSQNSNSQNTINTNIPALSLCSTNNNNITIEEKNVDQQETELSEEYNDILIEKLRDNLNNIFKEGQYDFQNIMKKKKISTKNHLQTKMGRKNILLQKGKIGLGMKKKKIFFFMDIIKKNLIR